MVKPLKIATSFKRYEQKYLLNQAQHRELQTVLKEFVREDAYGLTTIYSIYYDTQDFKIIRKSLNAKKYKEKLRLRSYGRPGPDDTVYFELKKKLNGITYKHRIPVSFKDVENYFDLNRGPENKNFIFNEIKWFRQRYDLKQKLAVSYDRIAFEGIENSNLRITFDTNICWQVLDNTAGHESPIINKDEYLMELKTDLSIPWQLSRHLTRLKIFPLSFSKYGKAYQGLLNSRRMSDHD